MRAERNIVSPILSRSIHPVMCINECTSQYLDFLVGGSFYFLSSTAIGEIQWELAQQGS